MTVDPMANCVHISLQQSADTTERGEADLIDVQFKQSKFKKFKPVDLHFETFQNLNPRLQSDQSALLASPLERPGST